MKESYWGYGLILLGILVIGVMLLVNSSTTGTTQDYYMLKEVTQASMIDAVDYSYYRLYGDVRISKQKFIENFIRRFSENTNISKNYDVNFYDIYEVPPKVSVRVTSASNSFNVGQESDTSLDLVNEIDAILEYGVPGITSDSSKPITKKMCYIEVMPAFGEYLKELYNGSQRSWLSSNYPTLLKWVQSGASGSTLKTAFNNQFPNLYNMDANEMKKDPLLKEAMNRKGICQTNDSTCTW